MRLFDTCFIFSLLPEGDIRRHMQERNLCFECVHPLIRFSLFLCYNSLWIFLYISDADNAIRGHTIIEEL